MTANLSLSPNKFLFGGKYGVGVAEIGTNKATLVQSFWSDEEKRSGKHERMRANDGAVDSRGRFWVNTIPDPETATSTSADGKKGTPSKVGRRLDRRS